MNDELIYALDVGTRKVMGIVARRGASGLEVLACDVIEHSTRAMSAGEVRDVGAVSEIIRAQTERLSAKTGVCLRRAAVAVAGRDLRTSRGRAALELAQPQAVDAELLRRAVHEAVQDALARLPRSQGGATLAAHYCVGYAATRFTLDGDVIENPLGHRAQRLEAEVLATTLPRRVLDGLAAALERAGLEPSTITLEPIAALQAAVPDELRRFHLALIDVGAGTSDVAILRDGEIQAFGMVPCAGDFVTEALADMAALDFFTAERAKRELSEGREARVLDVFDRARTLSPAEVLPKLAPAVRELAARAAECVRALGGGSPRLALCVGGGSLTPGFEAALAAELGMPEERVGRRRASAAGLPAEVAGPQAATPLGIALVAASERGLRLRRVRLDERAIFALEIGRPLTAADALAAAGVPPKDVYGRLGLASTITLNGSLRAVRGGFGRPARVECDGQPIALDAPLPEGASLRFTPAEPGLDARPTLGELLRAAGLERSITLLGKPMPMRPIALVNGKPAEPGAPLADRAVVETLRWPTAGELLEAAGVMHDGDLLCDGRHLRMAEVPADGAVIEAAPAPASAPELHEDLGGFTDVPMRPAAACAPAASAPAPDPFRELSPRPTIGVYVNGERFEVSRPSPEGGRERPVLLVDLLPRLGTISLRPVPGRRLKMAVDGRPAGYTSPLHEGAEVTIRFD